MTESAPAAPAEAWMPPHRSEAMAEAASTIGAATQQQPADDPGVLFERAPSRPMEREAEFLDEPPSVPVAYGDPVAPDAGSSLFDRYASDAAPRSFLRNTATLTSRMRSTGFKITCYLNTEANRSRSTVIHLPDACDTVQEVFDIIQRRMQLDKRMLYVAEIFLPDGRPITQYKQLIHASNLDTPLIVGCGEPFDHFSVPPAMLAFHVQGGGRASAKVVKKQMADKKMRAAQLKADQVRASGHGVSSAAAQTARAAAAEANRESAAVMRHDYMNQLIARSTQQNELIRHVQANNARLRSERAHREAKANAGWSAERMQAEAELRRREASVWRDKLEHDENITAKKLDRAKAIKATNQAEGKFAKSQLNEQRKAAGLERRMSYISRSVEKAAQEQDIIHNNQMKKQMRKTQLLGLRSPLTSQVSFPPSAVSSRV